MDILNENKPHDPRPDLQLITTGIEPQQTLKILVNMVEFLQRGATYLKGVAGFNDLLTTTSRLHAEITALMHSPTPTTSEEKQKLRDSIRNYVKQAKDFFNQAARTPGKINEMFGFGKKELEWPDNYIRQSEI